MRWGGCWGGLGVWEGILLHWGCRLGFINESGSIRRKIRISSLRDTISRYDVNVDLDFCRYERKLVLIDYYHPRIL